jgi:DNA-binding response OmpR family regulator
MEGGNRKDASEQRVVTPSTRRRIILVDDNYAVADGLKWALEAAGHNIAGMAASVATAQALIEETSCDFAILDIDLKGESIVAVARRLAERAIPFMFITGFGDTVTLPPDLTDAPRLEKPADLNDILATIEVLCPIKARD